MYKEDMFLLVEVNKTNILMWTAIIFTLALFCSYVALKGIIAAFIISDELVKKNKTEYKAHENFTHWFSIISCILWGVFYYITY